MTLSTQKDEQYFSKLEKAKWPESLITSGGDVVEKKSSWLGRLCCTGILKGYNPSKGIKAIELRMKEYLNQAKSIEDRVVREHNVHGALNNVNVLITDHVNKKSERIKLLDFKEVNAVPEPVQEVKPATRHHAVKAEVEESSSERRRKRTSNDLALAAAKAFLGSDFDPESKRKSVKPKHVEAD